MPRQVNLNPHTMYTAIDKLIDFSNLVYDFIPQGVFVLNLDVDYRMLLGYRFVESVKWKSDGSREPGRFDFFESEKWKRDG